MSLSNTKYKQENSAGKISGCAKTTEISSCNENQAYCKQRRHDFGMYSTH